MKFLVVIILVAAALYAATSTTTGYVPATDTAVATSTKALVSMHLNNVSGGTSTCSIKDRSTNCGGGVCTLWGPAPLAAAGSAGSIVSWPFYGLPAPSGFTWSCTVASSVVGSITYQ